MVFTLPPHLVQQQVPAVDWRQQVLVSPSQTSEMDQFQWHMENKHPDVLCLCSRNFIAKGNTALDNNEDEFIEIPLLFLMWSIDVCLHVFCICMRLSHVWIYQFFSGQNFSLWQFLDLPKLEPFIKAEQRCVMLPLVLHVLYTSGEYQLGWYSNMLCIHDISGAER